MSRPDDHCLTNCDCYSVRQLSPFVGSIHIVEADYCRALSSDGVHWQIQASCETHQQRWKISDEAYTPRRYVLYGSWSVQGGFSHLPLDPMLDVPKPQHVQQQLIEPLEKKACELPFAPLDHYECWLMQDPQTPLALLASATHAQMIPHIQPGRWQALPQQDYATDGLSATLQEQIKQLEAAINSHTQQAWFKRESPAKATALTEHYLDLPDDSFPELLINLEAMGKNMQATAMTLIDWLSPRLLSLPQLSADSHNQLQQLAQHHALETHRRLAVYPQPLSSAILNKILVELKIRGV